MVATGYQRDATGAISSLTFANPADKTPTTMSRAEFEGKWSDLQLDIWKKTTGKSSTGLNHFLIAMAPNGDRMVTGADGIQRKASNIELPTSSPEAAAKAKDVLDSADLWGSILGGKNCVKEGWPATGTCKH